MEENKLYNALLAILGESATEAVFDSINWCLMHQPQLFTNHDKLALLYHLASTTYTYGYYHSENAVLNYQVMVGDERD